MLAASAIALSGQRIPVEGRADSAVRVVIYEDLQCGDCALFRVMLDQKLLPRYGDRVAFIHRDFPLAKHAWARKAALAGRFFAESKPAAGLEWRRHIMTSIRETGEADFNARLTAFAARHGFETTGALAALEDPKYAALVEKDFQEGVARGVSRTPTVVVNGKTFVETFTFEEIAKEIEQALAEAGQGDAGGR